MISSYDRPNKHTILFFLLSPSCSLEPLKIIKIKYDMPDTTRLKNVPSIEHIHIGLRF